MLSVEVKQRMPTVILLHCCKKGFSNNNTAADCRCLPASLIVHTIKIEADCRPLLSSILHKYISTFFSHSSTVYHQSHVIKRYWMKMKLNFHLPKSSKAKQKHKAKHSKSSSNILVLQVSGQRFLNIAEQQCTDSRIAE